MSISVVIADDHPSIIKGVQTMLHECSFIEVLGAYNNGRELLEGLQSIQPDVVLLDIQMPGKTGEELAGLIMQKYPSTKVLVLTNLDQTVHILTMLRIGVSGYLLKTAGYNTMVEAIKSVYDGLQYIDSSLRKQLQEDMAVGYNENNLIPVISQREKEVLQFIAENYTSNAIAERLHLSKRTIDFHRTNLLIKFDVTNSAALIKKAIDYGLLK